MPVILSGATLGAVDRAYVLKAFGSLPLAVGRSAKINANNGRGDEEKVTLSDFVCKMEYETRRKTDNETDSAMDALEPDSLRSCTQTLGSTSGSADIFVSVGDRQRCRGPEGQMVNGRARCAFSEDACKLSCLDLADCHGYTHSEDVICSGKSWTVKKGVCFLHGPGLDEGLSKFEQPAPGKPMKISSTEWEGDTHTNAIIGEATDIAASEADFVCKRRITTDDEPARASNRFEHVWDTIVEESEPAYLFDQGPAVESGKATATNHPSTFNVTGRMSNVSTCIFSHAPTAFYVLSPKHVVSHDCRCLTECPLLQWSHRLLPRFCLAGCEALARLISAKQSEPITTSRHISSSLARLARVSTSTSITRGSIFFSQAPNGIDFCHLPRRLRFSMAHRLHKKHFFVMHTSPEVLRLLVTPSLQIGGGYTRRRPFQNLVRRGGSKKPTRIALASRPGQNKCSRRCHPLRDH